MNVIIKIIDKLFFAAVSFARALLVFMVLLVTANVVLRYVFNSGIAWSEEIVLVIVIWFTFIAMALGVKEDLHININVLPKKTPVRLQLFLYGMKQVMQITLAVVMLYYGTKLSINGAKSFLPATHIPNTINYLVLPISGVFILVFSLKCLFKIRENASQILQGEKINV